MISEFITRAFAIRDCAHFAHWATTSGFHHEVLGDFYEQVIELTDKLVEAYIGNYDTVPDVQTKGYKFKDANQIVKCLEEDVVWMTDNCEDICADVEALENILQEIQGLYLTTITKLKRFK